LTSESTWTDYDSFNASSEASRFSALIPEQSDAF
jgi:hypothetical protein